MKLPEEMYNDLRKLSAQKDNDLLQILLEEQLMII